MEGFQIQTVQIEKVFEFEETNLKCVENIHLEVLFRRHLGSDAFCTLLYAGCPGLRGSEKEKLSGTRSLKVLPVSASEGATGNVL